eukprot:12307965-Alexandrium_andersonii.AAC.1
MLLALIASEPLDALNQRLQHLDSTSHGLREITDDRRGVIVDAQAHLHNLMLGAQCPVPVSVIGDHFGSSDEEASRVVDQAR